MNRRHFIQMLAASPWLAQQAAAAQKEHTLAKHWPGTVISATEIPLPEGKREPFGWKTAAISDTPLTLAWPGLPATTKPTALRLTVGLDVRDEKLIEAFLPKSGRVLGTFDVRFGCIFQVFSIPIEERDAEDILREGVALRLTKGTALRVFTAGDSLPTEFQPHLLVPGTGDPLAEFYARMNTLACVQAFGWQEGCVLDGLLDLAAAPTHTALKVAARRHFDRFIINGKLTYENNLSVASDGRLYGIEGALPFAALAKLDPQHTLLDHAVQALLKRQDAEGCIQDGQHTSSEGAYTVGYPLAVIAAQRQDEALQRIALRQLSIRQGRLFDGTMFWRTSEPKSDGTGIRKGNRAWARGVAWQLLGYARTLRALKHRSDLAPHLDSFRQLAAWTLPYQRADGQWSVFLDRPELTPDTSGSAGIAAALAIGASEKWLPDSASIAATKTLASLKMHLTEDGFLRGVSQANKAGEELQRGDYRVVYQMGMGLMAQLIAALKHE